MSDLPISTCVTLAVKQPDGTYQPVSADHPLIMGFTSDAAAIKVSSGVRLPGELVANIAMDESVSQAITVPDGYRIDSISFGTGWVGKISFQESIDEGTTWKDLTAAGVSIEETPVADCAIPLTADMSLRVSKKLMRIQSGIMGALTTQTSAQIIRLSLISM